MTGEFDWLEGKKISDEPEVLEAFRVFGEDPNEDNAVGAIQDVAKALGVLQLRSELSALQEEVERLRKDAGRYRTLRSDLDAYVFVSRLASDEGAPGCDSEQINSATELDQYIDSLSGGDE